MSADEGTIWGYFLSKFGKDYKRFDYDLRVGQGTTPIQSIPENFIRDYQDLTKARIDAVGYNDNLATIFEVKQRASLSAIGQLIGYSQLFRQTFPNFNIEKKVLVCSSITKEYLKLIEAQGIVVIVLP